ncbi:MAG: hypothetical protein ABL902_08535 [Gallionella sp.]|nr:hypothetical protein [Gallionella sp.]
MRACFTFLLAIMVSLNAAYAASLTVCDALEHSSRHGGHFGHQSHHDHERHEHNGSQVSIDSTSQATSDEGHHHSHVHSSFVSILQHIVGFALVHPYTPVIKASSKAFISAILKPLDHPPQAILA